MQELIITSNPIMKLRGLVGRPDNVSLLMENCCDIHTFTMSRPIDVAFLDDSYVVIDTYFGLKPHKRIRCRDASHVIERFSDNKKWARVGKSIFACLAEEAKGNISVRPENSITHKNEKYKINLARRKNESMSSM